jgi:ATP-dependent Clp protease ATP-binding subunit ClpA
MFEIFTDRARKVVALAKKEASDSTSVEIKPHHLLVGLLKESSGVAHHVLEEAGLSVKSLWKGIQDYTESVTHISWNCPELQKQEGEKLPYSQDSTNALQDAHEEAKELNHNFIGTEHILLGLLRPHEGEISKLLQYMGINVTDVRKLTIDLITAKPVDEIMAEYEELKKEKDKWVMCGSYNYSHAPLEYKELERWILKEYDFILDNLVSKKILVVEDYSFRIEIDYNYHHPNFQINEKCVMAIRVYKRKL